MSDILQITTPITPREYQNTNRHNQQSQPTDTNQVFNLGDQTKIVRTNERAEDYAEQDLKDSQSLNMPRSASGTGSPSGTLDTVKELLSSVTMAALREKGDAAMMNKISAFAEEVVLRPENLLRDMITQQENATIFSGKLWDALRGLANSGSEDMRGAVLDFAKAAAYSESKEELLESLSANFKYLAHELAPSKAVSEELMKASEALAGPDAARNFTAIKSTLVRLVNYTSSSLLLDNRSQNLLPLVIHNISRYNDNPASLRTAFDTLLQIFDNIELSDAEMKYLADTLGTDTLGTDANGADANGADANGINANSAGENTAAAFDIPQELLEGLSVGGAHTEKLRSAPNEVAQENESASPADILRDKIRSGLEKQFDDFIIAGRLPQDVKRSSIISSDTLREQSRLSDMTKLLTIGIGSMAKRLDTARLKDTLSGIDPQRGSAAVKLALASVTPNTPAMAEALDSIVSNYDKTGDLQSLIDRLGTIINSIDDMDKKMPLAQVLNEALGNLAEAGNSNYKPPTSIDILSDFLLKNIDDPSLRSVTAMNKNDMIQTMLTSPGVFNPLMHFFVPLDAFGMRSFAELWVDRNADRDKKKIIADPDGDTSHVFMCFDMENVGYFELEMFAKGKNLNVMLLCPEGKEAAFSGLKDAVPKIAAGVGYTVGTTIVDTLYKKRSLEKIFPRLRSTGGEFHANA